MIAYGYRQCSSNLQTPKRVKSIPTSDSEHLSLASTHKSPKALTFEHSMRGTELRRGSSADFGHKVGGNTSSSNSSIRYRYLGQSESGESRVQLQTAGSKARERERECVCEDKRKTKHFDRLCRTAKLLSTIFNKDLLDLKFQNRGPSSLYS